ncbi:hypothetical protein K0N33_004205 [Salmonella enterica]|nr:hypothetical protein [Salmonella enterica]
MISDPNSSMYEEEDDG